MLHEVDMTETVVEDQKMTNAASVGSSWEWIRGFGRWHGVWLDL